MLSDSDTQRPDLFDVSAEKTAETRPDMDLLGFRDDLAFTVLPEVVRACPNATPDDIAERAYDIAQAMIDERQRRLDGKATP